MVSGVGSYVTQPLGLLLVSWEGSMLMNANISNCRCSSAALKPSQHPANSSKTPLDANATVMMISCKNPHHHLKKLKKSSAAKDLCKTLHQTKGVFANRWSEAEVTPLLFWFGRCRLRRSWHATLPPATPGDWTARKLECNRRRWRDGRRPCIIRFLAYFPLICIERKKNVS